MGAKVRRYADIEALSRAAAEDFVALANEAIAARGVFHVALAGGSTPKKLFDLLAARGKSALAWDKITLWWGDERAVPPDHPDSNYGMAKKHLIDPLGLDPARIHRIKGELDPKQAAAEYLAEVTAGLGSPPVGLDLVLLGMGPDGHTLSLFPNTAALDSDAWVVANELLPTNLPGKCWRVTMTVDAVEFARHVRFTAAGADKAKSLREVLEGARDPRTYPSQLINGPDVQWLVDEAAAKELSQ